MGRGRPRLIRLPRKARAFIIHCCSLGRARNPSSRRRGVCTMRTDLPTAAFPPGPAGRALANGDGTVGTEPGLDLRAHGLINPGRVYANLSPPALTELALARGEGLLSARG